MEEGAGEAIRSGMRAWEYLPTNSIGKTFTHIQAGMSARITISVPGLSGINIIPDKRAGHSYGYRGTELLDIILRNFSLRIFLLATPGSYGIPPRSTPIILPHCY